MAVRNFWFEADVDGYHTQLSGGPRSKDGRYGYCVVPKRRRANLYCNENLLPS